MDDLNNFTRKVHHISHFYLFFEIYSFLFVIKAILINQSSADQKEREKSHEWLLNFIKEKESWQVFFELAITVSLYPI